MERKWCFDRLYVLQEAIVTQGCTFVSFESLINVKDAIPQVISNNKEFNQWTVPRHSRMGSICHSSVVSSTQCARDNDDANIDFSNQHGVSATWELSEEMEEWTQPTQQTTKCSTVETQESCLVAERLRVRGEMSSEAIVTFTELGNSAVLDFKEGTR